MRIDMQGITAFSFLSAPMHPARVRARIDRMVAAADAGNTPYDLVFIDWKMPGLNGQETAELHSFTVLCAVLHHAHGAPTRAGSSEHCEH